MTIKLVTDDRIAETSSKGNQEKWREHGRWYKLDLFGYEGLAETATSSLLAKTNVEELGFRYVTYRMEKLDVHRRVRLGCSSADFLEPGDAILTVADLLRKGIGPDWQSIVKKQPNLAAKIRWIAERVTELTGLERFGVYLTLLFEVDMLFGNEDRHLNNIAVLRRGEGFDYCPIFDFGAGLLSNIRDYPMDIEPKGLLGQLRAKPMDCTFTRQVRAAQATSGPQLRCDLTESDVLDALEEPLTYYAQRDIPYLRDRILYCIKAQQKKLFA